MVNSKFTAAHWGTYKVDSYRGKDFKLSPFDEDKDPSDIGKGIESAINSSTRIHRPAIRKGWLKEKKNQKDFKRGEDEFVEVSWDDAFELVGAEIKRVIDTYGNESIYAGSYGWASADPFHHAQSHLRRFLNLIGGHIIQRIPTAMLLPK